MREEQSIVADSPDQQKGEKAKLKEGKGSVTHKIKRKWNMDTCADRDLENTRHDEGDKKPGID